MKAVTKLPSNTITCAIAQVVGELENLGQQPRISDIAAFLGCTKPTAQKYLTKAIWSKKVRNNPQPYHGNARVFVYSLDSYGKKMFNTPEWISAKNAVYAAQGFLQTRMEGF